MTPRERAKFLETCNIDFVNCVCECVKNVLKGNVPLTVDQLKKLKRRKRALRELVLKKTSNTKRRRIIQTGGFLGALIPAAIGILGGLLNR